MNDNNSTSSKNFYVDKNGNLFHNTEKITHIYLSDEDGSILEKLDVTDCETTQEVRHKMMCRYWEICKKKNLSKIDSIVYLKNRMPYFPDEIISFLNSVD